ncbi:histidine kinase [Tolypothrix sp. VBCCA 56010]
MGHGAWGMEYGKNLSFSIRNCQCPLPIAHCPLPIAHCPTTNN